MERQQNLFTHEKFVNLIMRLRSKGVNDSDLFAALEKTPRSRFVEGQYRDIVYQDTVLPIECGEYIERIDEQMMIISALELEPKHRVLEIGTGSGFSAALMARLSGRVTTIERYKTLYDQARAHFQLLKFDNINCRQMDGGRLASNLGPFDRIVIWPSMDKEPQKFIELLSGNGILIVPIGPDEGEQIIVKYNKVGTRFERSDMMRVRYQPFIDNVAMFL